MAVRDRGSLERIRVLRIITRLNIGGPTLHVSILSSRLDPDRFETTLVAGRQAAGERAMAEMRSLGDLRPVLLPVLRREISPVADIRTLAAIVALVRRIRPHIVHTHLAKAGLIGRVAARLLGVPIVLHTFHGTVFSGYFGARASRAYLNTERALARISTRLIAISPAVREELRALRLAPAERIVEIPLGIDLAPFDLDLERRQARSRLGLDVVGQYVAIVGRLVPIKDVATFLRGFALVAAVRPNVTALIVGDGTERADLERLAAALGIGGRCRFLGWVADTPALYAAVDVVALTSLNEGTPVTLIEAIAARRSVVATRVGGVPDVVSPDAGRLVSPRSPAALADALASALENPGPPSERARREIFARFSADRLVRDTEALYLELMRDVGR